MVQQVRLKKPTKDREAESTFDTVQEIVKAIEDGVFDPYIDVIFKAFDERIRKSQEEDGDGELPTRERSDKLRSMRIERKPVVPIAGREYRVRGEKYQGVVVVYVEMAGVNSRGAAMALVEAVTGNLVATKGQRYKIPLIALEEIPDMKAAPATPSKVRTCKNCGGPVKYSGQGRPRSFCDNCLK